MERVREVVARGFIGQINVGYFLSRPLQLKVIKAVCFAVLYSIRFQRVRRTSLDGNVGTAFTKGTSLPDDLMLSTTPEVMEDAVSGPYGTLLSLIGVSNDEGSNYKSSIAGSTDGHIDQSSPLSP